REFEAADGVPAPALVLAIAPGLGRPRPRRTGEACGVVFYAADRERLEATTYAWDGSAFRLVGLRSFPRG
ncbi:MAG TPA: hypothetical protein VNJ46_03635, partial [Gaiellaceae bacterium]|nr:hypothetical protein [Gaiellaceae bacterium]